MNKEFSKFFVASLKRTAQNVSPLVRRKQKLQAEIAEREEELKSIQVQLDTYEAFDTVVVYLTGRRGGY